MDPLRSLLFACGVCVCLVPAAVPVAGATAGSWSASTAEEFAAGRLDGTLVDAEGRVALAPTATTLWGPADGIVWAVAADGAGGAFVALSGPGRVLRVRDGVEPEVWFEAEGEELVTALAADGSGGVFFGVSPGGRVMHAATPGEAELRLDSGATFVWAVAYGSDDTLWAGTGVPGRLIRQPARAPARVIFDSGEDPVRSIAALEDGAAVVGTGGKGHVIRVSAAGRRFVLLDAEEDEVVSVAAAPDGRVWALATRSAKQVGSGSRRGATVPPGATRVRVTATPPGGGDEENGSEEREEEDEAPTPSARRTSPQSLSAAPGGTLYRIDPDGGWLELWKVEREMPFAMLRLADAVLVATGDSGRLYRIEDDGRASRLLRIASNQASALAQASDGSLLVGGTTDARLERLVPEIRGNGDYLSAPIDAGTVADWGRVEWRWSEPRDGKHAVMARAGNTEEPDETWTDWVELPAERNGGLAGDALPATRWLQLKVSLSADRAGGPRLERLAVVFQPRNRAPRIKGLSVEPPGVVLVPGPVPSSGRLGPVVIDDPVARRTAASFRRRVNNPVRRSYESGARTLTWAADDPDDDRLDFSLDLRQEGEGASWFPLARGLDAPYYSWDARGLPDGQYRVRLIASDAPDRPAGGERTDRRTSSVFLIDNTRPTVGGVTWHEGSDGWWLEFVAEDAGGRIAAAEWARDGDAWRPLLPRDGVADSGREEYRVRLSGRSEVMIRVTDVGGNLGGELVAPGAER